MNDYIQRRNAEICRIARRIASEVAASGGTLTMAELAERVLDCAPSAHYVSYDNASSKVRRILRGCGESEGQEQWAEIARQVTEMMGRRRKLKLGNAISMVLAFCRPTKFYLRADTVYRVIRSSFSTTIIAN